MTGRVRVLYGGTEYEQELGSVVEGQLPQDPTARSLRCRQLDVTEVPHSEYWSLPRSLRAAGVPVPIRTVADHRYHDRAQCLEAFSDALLEDARHPVPRPNEGLGF